MKPIKHMRSKRGFYIGRVREVNNRIHATKVSPDWAGVQGRGMAFSNLLMTLASEHHKGTIVADPKANFHEKIKNGNKFG
ncbi:MULTISPECIES: hypothetical protein [Bacillus]|uniref:hypothetical protein n=1 Tax=Bacillus TaxID=1386 RepID=UPI00157436F8|nr:MULTISPECIES: hypothetical protein [Bacillus]MBC6975111.1 hypothetical protein [Bacillus sp. Xin]MBY0600379.1 hypothetical protein [Bacillus bingmayongensis]NSW38440.1 hypothetical protein [Bacillus sp. Xin1]